LTFLGVLCAEGDRIVGELCDECRVDSLVTEFAFSNSNQAEVGQALHPQTLPRLLITPLAKAIGALLRHYLAGIKYMR